MDIFISKEILDELSYKSTLVRSLKQISLRQTPIEDIKIKRPNSEFHQVKESDIMFYLIRHGETNYIERNTKIYQGFGVNLSPLTETGVKQIKETAKDSRLKNADIILSSPYTRALQTAAILSKELGIEIVVETDLHEWLANKNYIYDEDSRAEKYYKEFEDSQGEYPYGAEHVWEDRKTMRGRVLPVLEKYCDYKKAIVVCHGMLIQAVTEKCHPNNGEIIEFQL